MTEIEILSLPRPCQITSHQFYAEGLCICLKDGIALVEHGDGGVHGYDLYGPYSLKFTDRGVQQ